ncbi:unnamed protein product [Acanthoscelides obtectus]|uniref:IMD domain-containing protein n=1 Tax=Acanthoscelides obtectus TaxID=200917 RepID=A0A9P0PGV8_ACAOB|nr:unnamed protein product [Acanthoscelides obtectus]CAK1676327.1 Metastasis suppressor protein 1 [Acanthoscelides obtectus]
MKNFTSVIMECLILPLQDKLEEWKKAVINLDKEHAKDYKRARTELKKRSTDTLRLQKKMRKGAGGSDVQKRFECGLQDVTERRQLLEETEKHAVRAALLEERGRFCTFVSLLKPVVDEEVAMLTEMGHLQEAVQQLEKHAADPHTLPPASEQVIADLKSGEGGWCFQVTPPSSPSSLGSRKSSMCSISSINSSSSSSSKSHHSPSHPWQRSLSQPVGRSGTMRARSVSSQDSGFISQDTLYPRPPSSFSVTQLQVSNMSEHSQNSSSSSTPCTPYPAAPTTTATWPNLQETMQFERAATAIISDRPHTISSAYEKGHQRPPLTVYTFQAPDQSLSQPASPVTSITPTDTTPVPPKSPASSIKSVSKPPLPMRCSSLERPSSNTITTSSPSMGPAVPAKIAGVQGVRVLPSAAELPNRKPSPLTQQHVSRIAAAQPTYVNMHELASMGKDKSLPPPPASQEFGGTAEKTTEGEKESSTSESSLESSSGYGSQTTFTPEDVQHIDDVNGTASKYCTLPRNNDIASNMRRRPLSMTAMGMGTMRNNLLRRGSMQTQKPPPPIRRTSSITNTSASSMGSLENLPPPPAFLLEPNNTQQSGKPSTAIGVNVAETVKALTELKHTPASPNSVRRMSASTQNIYQNMQTGQATCGSPQSPILSTFQSQTKVSYVSQSGGVVYAQPSQFVGGSPNAVRRINNFRSQSADRKSEGPVSVVGSTFIASLSAKLAPQLSPRSSRRHSEDHSSAMPMPKMPQRATGPGQSFLDSLNAKLAQQHKKSPHSNNTNNKGSRIRQLMNDTAKLDVKECHDSLMDQIRRGTTLKRTDISNDRSAPKIF